MLLGRCAPLALPSAHPNRVIPLGPSQVQHGAAHGRQGLGRSDMPKKVAGARWCGTKTKISDGNDDEEEEEEEGHEQGSGRWVCMPACGPRLRVWLVGGLRTRAWGEGGSWLFGHGVLAVPPWVETCRAGR